MYDYRNSPTIKFCADVFSAHRCHSIKFKKRLERASVNRWNLWISKDYFLANKMKSLEKMTEIAKIYNFSKLRVFPDQSCVNRTETVHGTLRFLFLLSRILYGICVQMFIMNRYISKSYTTTKNTIDWQYTQRGQLYGQLLLVYILRSICKKKPVFITLSWNCAEK